MVDAYGNQHGFDAPGFAPPAKIGRTAPVEKTEYSPMLTVWLRWDKSNRVWNVAVAGHVVRMFDNRQDALAYFDGVCEGLATCGKLGVHGVDAASVAVTRPGGPAVETKPLELNRVGHAIDRYGNVHPITGREGWSLNIDTVKVLAGTDEYWIFMSEGVKYYQVK